MKLRHRVFGEAIDLHTKQISQKNAEKLLRFFFILCYIIKRCRENTDNTKQLKKTFKKVLTFGCNDDKVVLVAKTAATK